MQIAAKAAPDGYTLLMGSSTQFSISPALRAKLPFDPVRDYTPIAQAALTPVILTAQAAHPARSLQELIQSAKAKAPAGDVMSYGSTGFGGAPHIAGELLQRTAGMPPAILHKINAALMRALNVPELREQFANQGVELVSSTPDALAQYVKSELTRWTKVLKEMGVAETP